MKATENIKIDGVLYEVGEEIWDLGSLECTNANGMKRDYQGFSKDLDKLPHYVDSGSTALFLDTGDVYVYHKKSDAWVKL